MHCILTTIRFEFLKILGRLKRAQEKQLSIPSDCTTRGSSRRKRVNEIESNIESFTFKLKRTLPSENENSSNSDHELHKSFSKRKKLK